MSIKIRNKINRHLKLLAERKKLIESNSLELEQWQSQLAALGRASAGNTENKRQNINSVLNRRTDESRIS